MLFLTYKEAIENSEAFKKGVEDFKEGKVERQKGKKIVWVKKLVGQKEWDKFYSQNNSYCNLGVEGVGKGKKVKIVFATTEPIPADCEIPDLDELRQVDNYRKASNIYPRPFEDVKI